MLASTQTHQARQAVLLVRRANTLRQSALRAAPPARQAALPQPVRLIATALKATTTRPTEPDRARLVP